MDIKQGREDFLFSLACRSEQKPTYTSFEFILQIKRPGPDTEYHPYPVTNMKDQQAVPAVAVIIAAV